MPAYRQHHRKSQAEIDKFATSWYFPKGAFKWHYLYENLTSACGHWALTPAEALEVYLGDLRIAMRTQKYFAVNFCKGCLMGESAEYRKIEREYNRPAKWLREAQRRLRC